MDADLRQLIQSLQAQLQAATDQNRALTELVRLQGEAMARIGAAGGMPAVPAPTRVAMFDLRKRWATAKASLASFECDNNRALVLLGWAPPDGPFAGIKLGDRDPMSLTAEDVDQYRAYRVTCLRWAGMAQASEETVGATTIDREVMILLRILNFGVARNTIARNPIRGLKSSGDDGVREVIIEEEGFDRVLHALGDDQMMRANVTLAYDSGMRETEVLVCRLPWLDPDRGFVHIPAAVAKNGHARVTDLSKRAWREVELLPRHIRSDQLWINQETGNLYNKRWIYEKYSRAVRKAGVTGRNGEWPTYHDLRRSWVTLMRRRGIAESVIMSKSGHQDHKVFRRYSIVADDDLRSSWEDMERGRQKDLERIAEKKRRGPHRAADVLSAGVAATTTNLK